MKRCDQALLLVDHADAQSFGVLGRMDLDRLSVQLDVARVGSVEPGEDIHQAGLAGAVFAEQRVDLAALDVQAGVVDGQHVAKALGDVAHAERRGHRVFSARAA